MVMQNPSLNNAIPATKRSDFQLKLSNSSFSQNHEQADLVQEGIEDLIDGILIITAHKELIYANGNARRILRLLNQDMKRSNKVSGEIGHICQFLIGSRSLFPDQNWQINCEIFIDDSTAMQVMARCLKLASIEQNCLLITLKDKYQTIKNIAVLEAKDYNLTNREKEVWLLHRANYTYKQIALELCITPNTVKKHMRSIHSKQKGMLGRVNASKSN